MGDTGQGQPQKAGPLLAPVVWAVGLGWLPAGSLRPLASPPETTASHAGDGRGVITALSTLYWFPMFNPVASWMH